MAGKLYLVGAGPGDPGLLTLKGKRCLEQADVVIYDFLANPRLLDYAPPHALRVRAGKHGGGTHIEQDVINALLVEHARAGSVVVRLKGGDPFIFGRGGEEAEVAVAAGIDIEIVPGVTSAVAVPAYAGIPLTHRDFASNVIFTTGYEYPSKPEVAVHWSELARSGSTLVILMTQRQLRSNMARLCAAGLSGDTPAALIQWGTCANQRTVVGTVSTIATLAEQQDIKPPALAIVGEVVRLRDRLNWFERRPLFGRRIVVTRPRAQAGELAEQLEAFGAEVVPLPTIETVLTDSLGPLDDAIRRAAEFDWVIFTSANGVRVFFERLRTLDRDLRDWHRAHVAAIGPQTAKALRAYCLRVECVPEDFRAEGLIDALQRKDITGKRILLPRAAGARDVLPNALRQRGATVEEVVTYRSVVPSAQTDDLRQRLRDGEADLITFTSSSTVDNFAALFDGQLERVLAHAQVGCIGPITAATARQHGMHVAIQPQSYTIPAFVDAIVRYYSQSKA